MSRTREEKRRRGMVIAAWSIIGLCFLWMLFGAARAAERDARAEAEMEAKTIYKVEGRETPHQSAALTASPQGEALEGVRGVEDAAPYGETRGVGDAAPYGETGSVEVHVIENCAITGYCACCTPYSHLNTNEEGKILVSSGKWVEPGFIVAVDPEVIPLGASVIIDNREYIAEDTGVIGNVVDILMTHEEAAVAGVRYETVKWYVEE